MHIDSDLLTRNENTLIVSISFTAILGGERMTLKAGMIANDRRRSRIADHRSQTIAKRAVAI